MKNVLTIIALLFTITAFSQDNLVAGSDSLLLNFQIMDSSHVKLLNKYINIDTCTFFFASPAQSQVAYSLDKKKKDWMVVSLTGDDADPEEIAEIKKISTGIRGKSILVVEGVSRSYGTGGGTGIYWLEMITMDSIPARIFNITYGCWDESFGDRNNNGEGSYTDEVKREIIVLKNGIKISPSVDKRAVPNGFVLTDLAGGTYLFKKGHLRKTK